MACLARCSCNSSSSFFKTSWVCHCTSCCMCEKNRHPLWGFLLWNWHVLTKVYPHAFSPKHKPRASYLKLTLLSSLTLDRHPSLHVKNWAIRLHLFFISQFWPHMEDRKTQSSSSFSSKDARAWLNSFASWRDSSSRCCSSAFRLAKPAKRRRHVPHQPTRGLRPAWNN